MPNKWPKIVSILIQQILILSVFAAAIWMLPDNYIEKSVPGRCQLESLQLQPLLSESAAPQKFVSLSYDSGRYKFKLQNTHCNNYREPILVIETVWLNDIRVIQTAEDNSTVSLNSADLGGRFFNYSLDNSFKDIEIEMNPLMSLKLNFSIWEKQDYQKVIYKLNIYFALIFSAFVTLFIINTLIYIQSRDQDYLRYLPFLFTNILFLAVSEGVFHSLGWKPDESAIAPLWWLAALAGYFGLRFIVRFSGMNKAFPRFTKYAVCYPSYLYLFGAVLTIFYLSLGSMIIRLSILWLTLIPWFALLGMLRANAFGTIYIFVAWTSLILGVAARTMYGLEMIELSRLVIYGIVLGSLLETFLLSLSLGYKMVQFREGQKFQLHQARTDMLTQLPNRRFLDEASEDVFLKFSSNHNSVAVAIIDCDRFKDVNDNYGHEVGDYVLKVISRKIRSALRGNDIVGRWGGEEFLCILPDVTESTVDIVMARLLDSIAGNSIQIKEHSIHTTVSVGLTFLKVDDTSMGVAIRRADDALYKAKQAGRAQLIKV